MEVLSANNLEKNQIEALWILADGMGHSNRDISKRLNPSWRKDKNINKPISEGHCHRDVIIPLKERGLIFSQTRTGIKTKTGKHNEIAYYIKHIALNAVHSVLKDQYVHKYHNYLNNASVYKKGLLSPEENKKYLDASDRFRILAVLEKEVEAYNDSLQKLVDLGIRSPDDPEAAGFHYGYIPPDEKYFFIGKSSAQLKALGITRLSISYP